MERSRLIPDIVHQNLEIEEKIFPDDDYVRKERELNPDIKLQQHMITFWKIHSDYLDAIIPNHKLTLKMFKLQTVLKESYDQMKATDAVDKYVPTLIFKSLTIQRDFLQNATRLASIFSRAQMAYINHLLTFGDPDRNVDSVWEFYDTVTQSIHQNYEDFSSLLTIILYAKSFLRALLENIKESYESTLHIIASCRDVLSYIEEFAVSHQ